MPYKRPLYNPKRYISPFYSPNPPYSMNSTSTLQQKDLSDIPLPNDREVPPKYVGEKRAVPSLSGIMHYIKQHVKIEEIILIGLIILMLEESVEDDLLLIILIYILLF